MTSFSPRSRYLRSTKAPAAPSWPGRPWPHGARQALATRDRVPAMSPGGCGRKEGSRAGRQRPAPRAGLPAAGPWPGAPGASSDLAAVWELRRAEWTPPSWQGLSHRDAPAPGLGDCCILTGLPGPAARASPSSKGGGGGGSFLQGSPRLRSLSSPAYRPPSPTTDPSDAPLLTLYPRP